MARECTFKKDSGQSSAQDSGSNEASGPGTKKPGCFKCGQPGHFPKECKPGWTGLSFLALRAGTKRKMRRTPMARCQGLSVKGLWKWRSETAMML